MLLRQNIAPGICLYPPNGRLLTDIAKQPGSQNNGVIHPLRPAPRPFIESIEFATGIKYIDSSAVNN